MKDRILKALARFKCVLGLHAPGEYLGKIDIEKIDYSSHAITYCNRVQCPRCGKVVARDYQIGAKRGNG